MIRMRPLVVLGAVIAVLITACSTDRGTQSQPTVLTINQSGPMPTFVQNWNIFSPVNKKAPGADLFYEPLVRLDVLHGAAVKPWLAESWAFSKGGRRLTFTLRDDVTFSDGKPFAAKDVKYTLELPAKHPKLGLEGGTYDKVSAPDAHTVVIDYPRPAYHDLAAFADRNMVPEHVWTQHKLDEWTNPEPVGTGPYRLQSFNPQLIKLAVRDGYWNGPFKGVRTVALKAFGSEDAGREMLLKNQLDWASMSLQDPDKNFTSQCDCHYWGDVPGLADEGLTFNTSKAPTNNVHVRRALYLAIDPAKINSLYDTGQAMANPTGLSSAWEDYLPDELRGRQHTADIARAKKELARSGYTVRNGHLTKGAKSYPITIKAVSDYTNWAAYAPGLTQQWKTALGLRVKPVLQPEDQHYDQQASGDFTVLYSALMSGREIYNVLRTELDSSLAKGQKEATGDFSRYHDPQVDRLLDKMAVTDDPAELMRQARAILTRVVDDVPIGPLHAPGYYVEYNATRWSGWPDPKTADYTPHFGQGGPDITLTIKNLRPR